MIRYNHLGEIIVELSTIIEPPERLGVAEAAERYRYVNNPGSYIGPWKNSTVPMMVEPMNTFSSYEYTGMIFVGPAQSGKPIWVGTPVATPSGWKTLGEIAVGDMVFGEFGQQVRVNAVTHVKLNRRCWKITFDDGTHIISDDEHRWQVNDMWADEVTSGRIKSTSELADGYKVKTSKGYRYRYSIPVAGALELPEADLPIDPYILGLYLGDGSHSDGALCIGTLDSEAICESVRARGCQVLGLSYANASKTAHRVVVEGRPGVRLRYLLQKNDLIRNKHIPAIYLRASVEQRKALLQGLLDTDATVTPNGRIVFTQSREELFMQVRELVLSLGYKPMCNVDDSTYSYKGEKLKGSPVFELAFSTYRPRECFTLKRHIERVENHMRRVKTRPTHTNRRFIRDISPTDSVPVRCISVDSPTHLFLVGDQMVPTHNTDSLILNPVVYSVKVDPMDMMIVCPTMIAARDFSIRRIDRLHRHSEKVGEMLLPGSDNDNTFDKKYKTGMLLSLSWPTPTELAGKPIGRVVLTDRDRMEDDVGGDGEPFDLASKRTTTFGSYAMTVAESSPSREVDNLKWIRTTPHEAPPCKGILALYNRGDRRRWYWPCPKCENYFEGNFKMFEWDKTQGMSNLEAAETVRMVCPHCSHKIKFDDRDEMQRWGVWVKDGQSVDKTGRVYGPKPRTLIASFWLNGVAAAFVTWRRLVAMYLDAHDEYERTGSEEALKKFYNNDLGEPYYPKALNDLGRLPETLKARAENLPERQVPEGVRFLIGNVDVQKNSFVVQVFGICPGKPFDVVVIDRFVLRKSQRRDHDGDAEWLRPSAYVEDWHEIRKHVMEKTYELGDGSGRRMAIKFTTCDSGGEEGVTTKAYEFYRELRSENRHRRFILTKGDPHPSQPRTRISYPDASRRDSKSGARGDVPVLLFNSNLLKDALDGRLDCLSPGQGMFRFPDWLSDDWFSEMCSEIRGPKGWERPRGVRNEAWDLAYYCLGVCASELIRAEHIDWENPPSWAKPWDENDLVSSAGEKAAFAEDVESAYDFGQFGKALA